MKNKIIPVILSGGSGTRLWPLSRQQLPKQYLSLTEENTMLQVTLRRLQGLANLLDPVIICHSDHRFIVAEQVQRIGIKNPRILLEPVARNTAPAIAAAALQVKKEYPQDNPILLVLSADHVISDVPAFHRAILQAYQEALSNQLVTFGIVPISANTGYGYLHVGESSEISGSIARKVQMFKEKPDLQTAERYVSSGDYYWNSGMFMFHADAFLIEFGCYAGAMLPYVQLAVEKAVQDMDFIRLDPAQFAKSPSDSIDYALMEKSDKVMMVPLDAGWNDVGSWLALLDIGVKDGDGNVIQGDVIFEDTTDSYIRAEHHMVATLGVKDLIIVDTPDATLVASKGQVHRVKDVVDKLRQQNRDEPTFHRKVCRPWGWYDVIEVGECFQVKRLHVNPGAKLSLQLHHQRAEHWVVVSGVATVTNGDQVLALEKGESTYIPMGVKHALENLDCNYLELIEVQSGAYLGEDDIVRFEDVYGRLVK